MEKFDFSPYVPTLKNMSVNALKELRDLAEEYRKTGDEETLGKIITAFEENCDDPKVLDLVKKMK